MAHACFDHYSTSRRRKVSFNYFRSRDVLYKTKTEISRERQDTSLRRRSAMLRPLREMKSIRHGEYIKHDHSSAIRILNEASPSLSATDMSIVLRSRGA